VIPTLGFLAGSAPVIASNSVTLALRLLLLSFKWRLE